MISVEWFDNMKCENCGKELPHCAKIRLEDFNDGVGIYTSALLLCSNCVADLIKRLS